MQTRSFKRILSAVRLRIEGGIRERSGFRRFGAGTRGSSKAVKTSEPSSPTARVEQFLDDATPPPKMKPVDRESLQQQSYQALREGLMKGRFMPGDTVSLRNLANELGTSPMPVREAVQHLIAEGALVLRPNRTYAVPEMTREILTELQQLRVILEGTVAEACVTTISAIELSSLYELQGQMRSALAVGDSKRYLIKNQDFHFTLYRSSGMSIAISFIETLWLRIGPSFNLLTSGKRGVPRREQQIASLTDHHEAALTAIAARDGHGLRTAIEQDIIDGMNFIIECTPA